MLTFQEIRMLLWNHLQSITLGVPRLQLKRCMRTKMVQEEETGPQGLQTQLIIHHYQGIDVQGQLAGHFPTLEVTQGKGVGQGVDLVLNKEGAPYLLKGHAPLR